MSKYIKKSREARARWNYVHREKHKHPYTDFKQLWARAWKKYPKINEDKNQKQN
jgi:hypothetical protein